ncbi:hypothetical protein ACDQ55_05245 [Chitinophaga sp. 30R24]|uniref:hypothetical protein n=1 Tax=Chitinophaga sp. 30R24 TaxID=3248838 RepID=UPI003B917A1C
MEQSVIKSLLGSAGFKLVSSIVPLIVIPILLASLGNQQYAIWVTMTTLIGWISLFDFGVGYSLKNKITESIAANRLDEVEPIVIGVLQFYILSAFVLLFIFSISLFYVKVFADHKVLAMVVYLPVIVSFPFTIGNFILQSLSKFILLNFLLLLQGGLWLIFVLINKIFALNLPLVMLGAFFSCCYFSSTFWIFYVSARYIKIDFKKLWNRDFFYQQKSSIKSGLKFFILQLSALILYSIGNVLMYDNMDLASIARFDIINKIFLLGLTIFNIVIAIFWVEISKYKAKNDYANLLKVRHQLLIISLVFAILSFLSTFIIPFVVDIWTGHRIHVETRYLVVFAALISIQAFAYSGAVFLNAFEVLSGQIVFSVISAIIMFPLSKFFLKIGLGINSVPLASALLTFPTMAYVLIKAKSCINLIKNDILVY